MPTYQYKCDACGHEFEKFQSITAPSIRKCPKCGKIRVKRLIGTGSGLIFKGGGFYTTDYRSDAYQKSAKADAPPAASTPSKSEGDAGAKSTKPAAENKPPAESKPAVETKAAKPSKKP
jgi:putative FmdB family regulatory protein